VIARPLIVVLLLAAVSGCDDGEAATTGVRPAPIGKPWARLAEWQLFSDALQQVPAAGVMPYEVISPLFSDYTTKRRFVWLPEGASITYRDDGAWDLPVGAIAIKSFAYPIDERDASKGERILETRLFVHEPAGWVPHTYVWDAAQATTERKVAGAFIQASWIDATGATQQHQYAVPTASECRECHGKEPTRLLGLKTAQLDRPGGDGLNPQNQQNQIDAFQAAGMFANTPTAAASRVRFAAPDDARDASLRARSYLDANCAHCHSSDGEANSKALYLNFASTDPAADNPANWGVCKVPTSAGGATCGHVYDVVPGDADSSVMICRMLSTVGSDQMPPIGRGLAHVEGVALVRAWIDGMEPAGCGN